MTGQSLIDSHADVGLATAVELVNALAVAEAADAVAATRELLVVDPPSRDRLTRQDVPAFVGLAGELRQVCEHLDAGDVDAAAGRVNQLLARHSAHPHLAREDGRWQLHHHPADAEVVPMWTAITADALARLVADGQHDRIGRCSAPDCDRFYLDTTKNRSRRFCSTTCQNRVKAAAFRRRHRAAE